MSVRFLRYVGVKQRTQPPTMPLTLPLATPPTSQPTSPTDLATTTTTAVAVAAIIAVVLAVVAVVLAVVILAFVVILACRCPCCCRCPRLSSSLTLLSSSPVVLTVLAGRPCCHCHRPHCCHPYQRCRPRPLLLPSSPVGEDVLDRCRRCPCLLSSLLLPSPLP